MNWCWNHLTLCIKASQSYLHRTTLRMCFCFVQFLPLTMAKSMNWRAYFSLMSFNFMIVICCLKSSQFKMRCENYSHWICFASLVHNTQIKKTNTLGMLTACQCNDVFSIAQIMSDCLTTANLWLFWVYKTLAACYCGCWLLVCHIQFVCSNMGRCMYESMHCVFTIYISTNNMALCLIVDVCEFRRIYRVCALSTRICSCFCPSENNTYNEFPISFGCTLALTHSFTHLHTHTLPVSLSYIAHSAMRVFTNTISLHYYAMNGILCFCLIPFFSFVIVKYVESHPKRHSNHHLNDSPKFKNPTSHWM